MLKKIVLGFILLTLIAISVTAYAHPGRLDKYGGHYVRTEGWGYPVGSYHYHYGSDRDTAYDAKGNVIPKITSASTQNPTPKPTTKPTPTPSHTSSPEPTSSPTLTTQPLPTAMSVSAPDTEQMAAPSPEPPTATTETPTRIKVFVDGEEIIFDQPPVIINDRVMVPIRFVVEKLDCKVVWDGTSQTVYINTPGSEPDYAAALTEKINVCVDNRQVVFPDQQPVNVNDRVLLPVRHVVEKLDCSVEWVSETLSVLITRN